MIFKKNKITKLAKTTIIYGSGVDTDLFKKKKQKKYMISYFIQGYYMTRAFLELINAIKEIRKKKSFNVLILGNPDKENPASV